MSYKGIDRRNNHTPDEEFQGLATRSLREGVPVDELDLRATDSERIYELRGGAKKQLLAMAGYTTERATEELSPIAVPNKELEAQEQGKCLGELKRDFDELKALHPNIEWVDVERSLLADKEAIREFGALNAKGHRMTVFGLNNGEFIFASAWTDVEKVAVDHRNIVFDPEAEAWLAEHFPAEKCNNGSAIAKIMEIMGVEEVAARNYLARGELHKQLIEEIGANGWAYLQTDDATRNNGRNNHNPRDEHPGLALYGRYSVVDKNSADNHNDGGSFRAARGVLKVA
jgi:hypothetical protein